MLLSKIFNQKRPQKRTGTIGQWNRTQRVFHFRFSFRRRTDLISHHTTSLPPFVLYSLPEVFLRNNSTGGALRRVYLPESLFTLLYLEPLSVRVGVSLGSRPSFTVQTIWVQEQDDPMGTLLFSSDTSQSKVQTPMCFSPPSLLNYTPFSRHTTGVFP